MNTKLFFLLIPLALSSFVLLPRVQAVTPAPDGGYPNGNTAEGDSALFSLNIDLGGDNTALGNSALFNTTTGFANTATGINALSTNVIGNDNTANGAFALFSNTASNNTANGFQALFNNTTGTHNTANGDSALFSNKTSSNNTADGANALFNNTAHDNTADGFQSLLNNTTGIFNTAVGSNALERNKNGNENTAEGVNALVSNTSGGDNTAIGTSSLERNSTGIQNTAAGDGALFNNTTGSGNIALGFQAGLSLTTGSNNIDIGNFGVGGDLATIRIGTSGTQLATFIAGISGIGVTGVTVKVNSSGQLGVAPSSERFKQHIQAMGDASDVLLALQPVTFEYKTEIDPERTPQFGLVAEEVEKVNPALVTRDADGKVYTVRYEAVNAMLLNEFLKQHRAFLKEQRKVEAQEATITQLKQDFQSKLAEQEKQIKALTSGLEKVNNQLELNKPAPQMVSGGQ